MKKGTSGNNNPNQPSSFYNQPTYSTPGQFQPPPPYPPPYSYPPSNNMPQKPPHHYRGWVLALFIICFVFLWVAIVAEIMALSGLPANSDASTSSSGTLIVFAIILFLAINIGFIFLDAPSYITLFGRIRWRWLKEWQKLALGILYVSCAIMPALYLFFAVQNFRRVNQQTLRQSVGSWYQSKSKNSRIAVVAVSLVLIIFFAILTGSLASYDRTNALLALTPTATAHQVAHSNNPTATSVVQDSGATATVNTNPTVIPTYTPTPIPSPTHQPTPTPTRTSQPTPKPTPRPTQPPPPTLAITFTCASAVDYSYGQVCVHTLSGAALDITVTYCSGYTAKSASLQGTVYANGSGNYTWYWTPQTVCRGSATAVVDASWNGQSASNTDNFNVQ